MKKIILSILIYLPVISFAQLNGSVLISGKILDDHGQPLTAASITTRGSKRGTTTDSTGYFSLVINQRFPIHLLVSSIGFAQQEIEVNNPNAKLSVQLSSQTYIANEIVVTASRKNEKLLQSPVTIEKLDIRALKETPSASFYDALGNIKGVQLTTSSLTFKVPNTRGFNAPNNFRFMQVVDGVDVQSATLGVPLGNAIGPTELDIQSVEITPGASSALYGMNAINGMSNLTTKDPFQSQGLSFYQQLAFNHIDDPEKSISPLTTTALRYAKAFNDKLAFKVNASYLQGTDWIANSTADFNPQSIANPAFPELSGKNNPAYDGVNSYGNETNIVITDKNSKTYNVRRTGYEEKNLTDYNVQNVKLDGGLHYKINPQTVASYTYRYGTMNGVFQRGNRIRLQGANVQNHKIEISNPDFLIRAYVSIENSGNSYAMKPLADNLELSFKNNKKWASDYTTALNNALSDGDDLVTAHNDARAAADNGRFIPGTAAFNEQVAKIKSVNDWDIYPTSTNPLDTTGGAAFSTSSKFYQAEGTWNLHKLIHFANVLAGADYRLYDLIPDGNNFVDFSKPLVKRNTPGGKDIHYGKYGGFLQASKLLIEDKLNLTASLRFDKNTEYDVKFNPRFSVVYTLNKIHTFRASWQNGFRFPSLFEAFSFVNNGGVRRVGGLPIVEQGLGYYTNAALSSSVTAFTNKVNALRNATPGLSLTNAESQASNLLKIGNAAPLKPEQINSFEVGYRSSLFDNKLFIDAEAYFNSYKYFIGQLENAVPKAGSVNDFNDTTVLKSLYNNSNATRYRVQANSTSPVKNYGYAVGVSYNIFKTYTASFNANYNKLSETNPNDPLIPGFNTPDWATNVSFGNRAVTKHIGFNVVWHWQDSFYWQNLFGNGNIQAYHTIDAQVTYNAPKIKSTFKLGGTDILNHKYYQYIGGPTISALYYVTWTIDNLF